MGQSTQTFDILTRVAVGSGSLVYRAVEKSTQREVALKLLTREGDLDHRMNVKTLLAEAPRYKNIRGAHVCQLLDAYVDVDGPVLVYEYADGVRGSEVPIERPLDAAEAVDVAAQLMDALCSAERHGVPHGDLKPSNLVLVSLPDGRPHAMVLDWALSAHRNAPSDDSMPYLAPERLAGEPASHAADLFSAGAVLFYLYTGKILVPFGSAERVAAAWKKVRPILLAELRPDLPMELVQWVAKLLEWKPSRRPASATAARGALEPLHPAADPELPVESSASTPASDPPECSGVRSSAAAPVRRRKNRRWPSFFAGFLCATGLAAAGFYYLEGRAQPAPPPMAGEPGTVRASLNSLELSPIAAGPEAKRGEPVLILTKTQQEREKPAHRAEKGRN